MVSPLIILTHGDSDGICSGALALAANPEATIFFTNPIDFAQELNRIPEGSSVIVCDIALNDETLVDVLECIRTLTSKNTLIYIDHHPFPPNLNLPDFPAKVIHDVDACSSELTYKTFKEKLQRVMSRVAIYGAIGDYLDNTPFVQKLLDDWDKRILYFEAGILIQGLEGTTRRDFEFKRDIVDMLAKNHLPSSNDGLLGRAVHQAYEDEKMLSKINQEAQTIGEVAYVLDLNASVGKAATYVRVFAGASVGIAGETVDGIVDMSLRTHRNDLDLNSILRKITKRFGGSGGGHPKASGARIPKDHFLEFVETLDETIKLKNKTENP